MHPQSPYQVFNLKPAIIKLLNLPEKNNCILQKKPQPWLSFGATSNSMGSATSVIKLKTGGSFRDTLACHDCKPQNNNGNFFCQCAIVLMSRNFRIFLWVSFRSCHHTVISCPPKGWLSKLCCTQKDLFLVKNQLDISFLFNNLNCLSAWIEPTRARAREHIQTVIRPMENPWETARVGNNPPHLDLNPSPLKCWHLLAVGFSPSKTVCQQGGDWSGDHLRPKYFWFLWSSYFLSLGVYWAKNQVHQMFFCQRGKRLDVL